MRRAGLRPMVIGSVLLLAVGGLGLAAVDKQEPAPMPSIHVSPTTQVVPATPIPQIKVTQASSKCSTSAGICFVEPLPVGSPCRCGDFSGVIIP